MTKRFGTKWILGFSTVAVLGVTLASLTGCDPIPRRTLTMDEKIADLYWIYSQFGENYAPLDYKQGRYSINYENLKSKYLEDAKKTTTNDEFYALMLKFVSEFKDAHTSAALTGSSLPDRAQVAFLGFSGVRNDDQLVVVTLLPTIAKDSPYPIKVGDHIVAINGKKLKEVVDKEFIQYRDTGYSESNYTYHFNKIFNRVSITNGLPKEQDAVLTVVRDIKGAKKEFIITLPWIVKDLVQFQKEQEQAKKDLATPAPATANVDSVEVKASPKPASENFLMYADDLKSTIMKFSFIGFDGRTELPFDFIQKITRGTSLFSLIETFKLPDDFAGWQATEGVTADKQKEPIDKLASVRKVLDGAIYISGSKVYPAYAAPVAVLDKDGKDTKEKKLIGYIYLDTFSPGELDETVMKEFKATLSTFKNLGIRDLIIDTINNGGGSVILGMKLAQALSPTKVKQPMIQFRLSDSWLDEFQSASRIATDEATREYARRIFTEMVSARQTGQRLSGVYSTESLARFELEPNLDLDSPFRIKLLVNEMCASMCDTFAGIIQDNQMGQVVGTRTMGAGGNVVNHNQAPNSHIDVRQTESLLLRFTKEGAKPDAVIDGIKYSYLENNGVTPDESIDVVKTTVEKYEPVLNKAVQLIAKPAQ